MAAAGPTALSAKLPVASMETGKRTEARDCAEEAAGPVFTLEEVGKRNSNREAWLVIHGRVYDVTRFLEEVRRGGVRRAGPGEGPGRGVGLEVRGAPGPSVSSDRPGEGEEKEEGEEGRARREPRAVTDAPRPAVGAQRRGTGPACASSAVRKRLGRAAVRCDISSSPGCRDKNCPGLDAFNYCF